MYLGIVKKDAVSRMQRLLKAKLKPYITNSPEIKVGHMGGSWTETANYSEELGIWWILDVSSNGNRYWNAFGIGDPTKTVTNIIVEINYPLEGVDSII